MWAKLFPQLVMYIIHSFRNVLYLRIWIPVQCTQGILSLNFNTFRRIPMQSFAFQHPVENSARTGYVIIIILIPERQKHTIAEQSVSRNKKRNVT